MVQFRPNAPRPSPTELCRFLEDADRFEANIGERPVHLLLHGDLKPRNVRITSAGQIKVLDFGIAKALSLSRKVTRNDFGSVAYLSPERLETGDMDRYADFWAVGVLLHEMISGAQPFQAPDTRRLEQLILSRRPPPPLPDSCPPAVRAVVAKLLGATPAMRYESARAIREELERVTAGAKTRAEEEDWLARVEDEQATRRTRPAPDADEEATRRTAKTDVIATPDADAPHTRAGGRNRLRRRPPYPSRRRGWPQRRLSSFRRLLLPGLLSPPGDHRSRCRLRLRRRRASAGGSCGTRPLPSRSRFSGTRCR